MKQHTHYPDIKNYITKDGSIIRELMHPAQHGNKNQSLAEAVVPAGIKTLLHRHARSEELYHVTQGKGMITLNDEQFEVTVGDTVCISPGDAHCIENTGEQDLKILCCCSPAYQHDDTELLV
ncbi:MAG: cupin domain-containing protein [Thioalkalispiraceae bacterium]|jgi:mannose-6-phosphate isomerase-like protein (cupin superfamily)